MPWTITLRLSINLSINFRFLVVHPGYRAVGRRNCVDGGTPVNFDRRRAAAPKNRRQRRWRPKMLLKDSRKNFVLFPKVSGDLLQQNKYTATMASEARRQIIGDGGALI